MYVCIYIYLHMYIHIYIYVHIVAPRRPPSPLTNGMPALPCLVEVVVFKCRMVITIDFPKKSRRSIVEFQYRYNRIRMGL